MRFWRQIKKFQVKTETSRRVERKEGSVNGPRNESKIEQGKCETWTVKKSEN